MPNIKTPNGIEWKYELEGGGEALLFIHGWGVDSRIWRQQTKYFSRFYQVLTVDLPGHGESSWKNVTLETMVEDIAFILEKLNITNLSIVGSSLGGLVALKFYESFPTKVKRLIFVASMPKFAKSEHYPHGLDVGKIRGLSNQLENAYPNILHIFFRSLFTKSERSSRRYKWLQRFRRNIALPLKESLLDYLTIIEKEDLIEVLKHIKAPVQFINGTNDEICTPEAVAFIQQLSPKSRFDFFDDCGHFMFLSKPHEFNDTLQRFLYDTH